MLTHIHIRDFAIVHNLELELGMGFTVLTGETGAGKSILIDALGLIMGDRADSAMVRHGAERADISATFHVDRLKSLKGWLQARELDAGEECLLRRTVAANGGSRAYINDQPVTLQVLKEAGEMLLDIHGQHAHQSLTRPGVQRELLDSFGRHKKQLENIRGAFTGIRRLEKERLDLTGSQQDVESRTQLLRYQVDELREFDPRPGEPEELTREHQRLANASQILTSGNHCLQQLNGDSDLCLLSSLTGIENLLTKLQAFDKGLNPVMELLDSSRIQLHEATDELRRYLEAMDLDPERLHQVEQRLSDYHDLARKHHVTVDKIPELMATLELELSALEQSRERVARLDREIETAYKTYFDAGRLLSESRAVAARKLANKVTSNMQELGLKGARFAIDKTPLEGNERITLHGMDKIEFLVSTNPGQPLKPLQKVASGGELSRISLCIQVISSGFGIPTLIFDEVDSGVGGGVAELVGQKLRALGKDRQVLCVTHLPQVASLGHHHLQVNKTTAGKQTRTGISNLGEDQRIEEIARMLGGVELTEQTMAHAREMLGQSR